MSRKGLLIGGLGLLLAAAVGTGVLIEPKLATPLASDPSGGKITHIVIIDQENRTPDNLLQDGACTSTNAQYWMAHPSTSSPALKGCITGASFASVGVVGSQQFALLPVSLCGLALQTNCNCHYQTQHGTCAIPANYDPDHHHASFVAEYNGGKMNGWNNNAVLGGGTCQAQGFPPHQGLCPMAYVPVLEVAPLVRLASSYTFNDNFFQDNQGPSHAAHQYIIAGTSGCGTLCLTSNAGLANNAGAGRSSPPPTNAQYASTWAINNASDGGGGCDENADSRIDAMDRFGTVFPVLLFPCYERQTLPDLIMKAGKTWKYYQNDGAGSGLWHGPDSIWHLWNDARYTTWVDSTKYDFFNDVCNNHTLASVTWITPDQQQSDHAGNTDGSGPDWVASIVNAIGGQNGVTPPWNVGATGTPPSYNCNGQFWNTTVIFVTWDDWGGWYDHVAPHIYNVYEKGFRVPLLTVSPYALTNNVDHTFASWGSLLKFTEEVFGLPSLGQVDANANDLSQEFNFSIIPPNYVPFAVTTRSKVKPRLQKHFHAYKGSGAAVDY